MTKRVHQGPVNPHSRHEEHLEAMSIDSSKRYQVIREIGLGDFATVYAARDLKLGREVAIKKIHSQFLADDEKLARYWQEAQLLVSLEHPNILTIYDVVKADGCLILELMQGSLKQVYQGRPMPVEDVRHAILQGCNGLQHLHQNGIIHGDIKPGNLLLSRQSLVKLGDFGLARRASDAEGSLLKGATKYMAPELVSDQFGPVGPASDLYSLGFSALEMMCGPEYDSLFPELNAFGRDKQMAWMMWHSSADRRIPPIDSMLEGVPKDLAGVLQKLTQKDQTLRYTSAAEVIRDLNAGAVGSIGDSLREEAEAAERERVAQKKRRLTAFGMFAASLAVCMAVLFWPEKKVPPPPPPPPAIAANHGLITDIDYNLEKFFYEPTIQEEGVAAKEWEQVSVFEDDAVYLNERPVLFRDLKLGDRVKVVWQQGEQSPKGKQVEEIHAYRPEQHRGQVASVDPESQTFVMKIGAGTSLEQDFKLRAKKSTRFSINQQPTLQGKAVNMDSLKSGDRIVVTHVEVETETGDSENVASLVDALRIVSSSGTVRDIDAKANKLTVADASGEFVTLPLAESCKITLNGLSTMQQRKLRPSDIRAGDKVSVSYDVEIYTVDASRIFGESGIITAIGISSGNVRVRHTEGKEIVYVIQGDTEMSLGGEEIALADLRVGDQVELTHDAPGSKTPPLQKLIASRPEDRKKWAILVANQDFDDNTLPELIHSITGAKQMRNRMIERYGIPPDQAILLDDRSRVAIEQEIPNQIKRVPADAELYFYIATHAYHVPEDTVYFAPKNFDKGKIALTGVKLDWLIDLLEKSPTKSKLLLLDCSHSAEDPGQPSSAEMIQILKTARIGTGGYPRSVNVLASCAANQRGMASEDESGLGFFAASIAEGFAGAADKQRDNKLSITELTGFVTQKTSKLSGSAQTPKFFPPDVSLPRLSVEAKTSINNLLRYFSNRKADMATVRFEAEDAYKLSNSQPEARLIFGLLALKFAKNANQREGSLEVLEKLVADHPEYPYAYQAIAWAHFNLLDYTNGQSALVRFVKSIPTPPTGKEYDEETNAMFEWIGRQRELAEKATWADRKTAKADVSEAIDQAIIARGKAAYDVYMLGRIHVRKIAAAFDKQISENPGDEAAIKLKRRRLSLYNEFDPAIAVPSIRAGMEK